MNHVHPHRWSLLALALCLACSEVSPPPPPPPPPPPAPAPVAPIEIEPPAPAPIVEPITTPEVSTDVLGPDVPPPALRRLAVSGGGGCAISDSGRVYCWGDTPRDDEDADVDATPRHQHTIESAMHVDMNELVGCAVTSERQPICWGDGALVPERDDYYGDDGEDDGDYEPPPPSYEDASSAIHADIGAEDACLVERDGAVFCGGVHSRGDVDGLEGIVEIAAGYEHFCARRRDGHVLCWGEDEEGQLGDGAMGSGSTSPEEVQGIDDAIRIASGDEFTCALRRGGRVSCWGDMLDAPEGDDVELGQPRLVEGLADVIDLFAGPWSACARREDGEILCWGMNESGVLGDGGTVDLRQPTLIPALRGATEIAMDYDHACARTAAGSIACWGLGRGVGALGPRGMRRSFGAVRADLGSASAPTGLLLFLHGSCVRVGDSLSCFGDVPRPHATQLGLRERSVASTAPFDGAQIADVQATTTRSCALDRAGTLRCGHDVPLADAQVSIELASVAQVSLGGSAACARMLDGTLRCFSSTTTRSGVIASSDTPTPMPNVPHALEVAVGSDSLACVITDEHRVHCFGGRVPGVQTAASEGAAPTQEGITDAQRVVATAGSICVLGGDTRVRCVGGTWRTPVDVGISGVRSLVAGRAHYCARVVGASGGEVQCWGEGALGQLARRPEDVGSGVGNASSTPLRIEGLDAGFVAPTPAEGAPPIDLSTTGIVEIAAGSDHTCARRSDGAVFCWGQDEDGELGALPGSLHLTPVPLGALR